MLLTSTAGLYTADPRVDPAARLVAEVDDFAVLEGLDIGHRTSALGSGGMRSKVVAAEMATAAGIPAVVCSGLDPAAVRAAADGEAVGTRFAPRSGRYSSFKLWLQVRQADPRPRAGRRAARRGRCARAARACCPSAWSTWPGRFDAGDAVEVVHDGAPIGKGICELLGRRAAAGGRAEVARRCARCCPRASDEAVHRDYFVLS